jgi:mannose-1-phosphate guanylyltransferase/mannose-1-phosphate guanylyltransferase/mannose-6-phosphate isomerase
LSGGAGTRLWPLSRENLPKQFLALTGERTLFQEAALRVSDPTQFEPLRVIASAQHRFLVAQQLQEAGFATTEIALESAPRNTAAAAAVAAYLVDQNDPEGLLLLSPADHRIVDVESFRAGIQVAAEAASEGLLCLFGVTPDKPATGYGYIRVGEPLAGIAGAHRVAAFVEKPDRETAEGYVRTGTYLWNSGIFLLSVKVFLDEMERLQPEIRKHAYEAVARASHDADFLWLDKQAFDRCLSISIDHAIMERTDRLAVIPVDCGWTDVGSWSTVADIAERDASGNTAVGNVLMEATRNSYVRTEGPLVTTVGVEDLIVIATPDAVLVAHKDKDQDIKQIVDRLRARGEGLI